MSLKEKACALKKQTSAVYLAFRRKDTPTIAKVMAALTIAYALSPIDLIPDFIPVLGYLDDIIILPLMLTACIKLIPKSIMDECKAEAEGMWVNGKPKKWYFAIPIALVWAGLLALAVWLVVKNCIK